MHIFIMLLVPLTWGTAAAMSNTPQSIIQKQIIHQKAFTQFAQEKQLSTSAAICLRAHLAMRLLEFPLGLHFYYHTAVVPNGYYDTAEIMEKNIKSLIEEYTTARNRIGQSIDDSGLFIENNTDELKLGYNDIKKLNHELINLDSEYTQNTYNLDESQKVISQKIEKLSKQGKEKKLIDELRSDKEGEHRFTKEYIEMLSPILPLITTYKETLKKSSGPVLKWYYNPHQTNRFHDVIIKNDSQN